MLDLEARSAFVTTNGIPKLSAKTDVETAGSTSAQNSPGVRCLAGAFQRLRVDDILRSAVEVSEDVVYSHPR